LINKSLTVVDIKGAAARIEGILSVAQPDESTFDLLDGTIVYAYDTREKAGILLSMSLSCMKDLWDDWPLTSKGPYKYDFYKYANTRTSYARVTVDNMIRAGRTWLQGLPDNVPSEVLLYDSNGEPTGEIVDPDPFSLSVSKLLVTSAAAKDGRLWANEVALGQLFNPDVGVHTVNRTIQRPHDRKSNEEEEKEKEESVPYPLNDSLRLYLEGPFVMVSKNGQTNWVVELNTEGFETDPMVKEAIKYLIAAVQIRE
jgi:hypothetical protein